MTVARQARDGPVSHSWQERDPERATYPSALNSEQPLNIDRILQRGSRLLIALAAVTLVAEADAQTTVDGVIFATYRYGLTKDSSFASPAAPNNFDIDRSYVNVRSKLDGGFASRITLDVDGRRAASNQLTIRVKYAYATWKPEGSALTWKLGMQPTPVLPWQDDLWGYRFQGTSPLDRTGYMSTSDFGAAVEGAWMDQGVNLDVGIFNGETYSRAPGDNHKDVAGRLSVRLLKSDDATDKGGLRLTGFALVGKATGGADRLRTMGLLSYQSKATTFGFEYSSTQDSTLASSETKGRILALFGTYNVPNSPVSLVGRLEKWDPNTDLNPAAFSAAASEQTRVLAGVAYRLAKNVRVMLDADVTSVQNGPANNAFQAANRSLYFHAEIKY